MEFHQAPHTFVGQVDLKVESIERSLEFYQNIIGFQVLEQTADSALLTADGKTPLLSIEVPKNVVKKEPRTTGLYHFALLLPARSDLAKVIQHFIDLQYPIQGASDHLVSEALYLADPDGNGIEIYSDRPSATWKWNNDEVVMTTEALDIESILAEGNVEPWNGLPNGTLMGHIHLHVAEFEKIEEFYCKGLGFDIVTRYGRQALFISTGGYHHHIGLNTWNGVGASTPSGNSVGLKWFTLHFPNAEARKSVIERLQRLGVEVTEDDGTYLTKDPSGNGIRLPA